MSETQHSRRHSVPKKRLFLESRYQKLVRDLPQTIFYCPKCKGDRRRRKDCEHCDGFGKLYKDSVQELIGRKLLPAFKAKFGKFHGAGREDVDVRMLGRGRPFVYEVVQPRRFDVNLEELLEEFHDQHGERVRLEPFRHVEKARVAGLKGAVYSKDYRAGVDFEAEPDRERLDALVGRKISVLQRTPRRVAHRRGDLQREREVEVLAVSANGERSVEITLRCEHGTYVKEWISGDAERTEPSLAELVGAQATCRELDVLEILDAG